MRLLRTGELSSRFEKRLEWAAEVDIAVAWVTSCDAVAALIESAADTKVRIAVGLSGNATDPSALESLADTEGVALRIAKPPRNGIFHWKYYCFRRAGEAEARQWFEDLWRTLDRDPTGTIAEYGERYKPPGRSPTAAEPPAHEPHRPGSAFGDWADFVRGLRARDEYCHYVVRHYDPFPRHIFGGETPWDIFGETHSYLHTIRCRQDGSAAPGLEAFESTGIQHSAGDRRRRGRLGASRVHEGRRTDEARIQPQS